MRFAASPLMSSCRSFLLLLLPTMCAAVHRWRGQEVDHSSFETTDCLDICEKKETQGNFSW